MTNWQLLPAGRELDRIVDESLGHKTMIDPYGNLVRINSDPDVHWEDYELVPEYSTKNDAALELLSNYNFWTLAYHRVDDKKVFVVTVELHGMWNVGRVSSFPLSACYAHLFAYEHNGIKES